MRLPITDYRLPCRTDNTNFLIRSSASIRCDQSWIPKKVVLTATVQSGPKVPITPVSGTTLAIHMDADIAKDLHEN